MASPSSLSGPSSSLFDVVSVDATRHRLVPFLSTKDVSGLCMVSARAWACFEDDAKLWKQLLVRSSHRRLGDNCEGLLERFPFLEYWTRLFEMEHPNADVLGSFFFDECVSDFTSRLPFDREVSEFTLNLYDSVRNVSSLAGVITRVAPDRLLVLQGRQAVRREKLQSVLAPDGMQALLSAA